MASSPGKVAARRRASDARRSRRCSPRDSARAPSRLPARPIANDVTSSAKFPVRHCTVGMGRSPPSSDCVISTSLQVRSRPSTCRNGSREKLPLSLSIIPSSLISASRMSPSTPTTVQYDCGRASTAGSCRPAIRVRCRRRTRLAWRTTRAASRGSRARQFPASDSSCAPVRGALRFRLGHVQPVASTVAARHAVCHAPSALIIGREHLVRARVVERVPIDDESAELAPVSQVDGERRHRRQARVPYGGAVIVDGGRRPSIATGAGGVAGAGGSGVTLRSSIQTVPLPPLPAVIAISMPATRRSSPPPNGPHAN